MLGEIRNLQDATAVCPTQEQQQLADSPAARWAQIECTWYRL